MANPLSDLPTTNPEHHKNHGYTLSSILAVAIAINTLGCWGEMPWVMLSVLVGSVAVAVVRHFWIRRSDTALLTMVASGDHAAGLEMLESIPDLERRSLAFQHAASRCHWHAGDRDAALKIVQRINSRTRYRLIACFDHIGMLLEQRERPGAILEAENLLRKIKRFKPSPLYALYATRIHIIRTELNSAESVLADALQRFPDDPDLRAQRAALWLEQGRPEEAKALLEDLLSTHPHHPHACILRARLSDAPEDQAAARAALEAAPDAFLTAAFSERHRFRLPLRDDPETENPRNMTVHSDLQGMRYTVSTWEHLSPVYRAMKWLTGFMMVSGVLGFIGYSVGIETLLVMTAVVVFGLATLGLNVAFFVLLLMAFAARKRFQANVSVDMNGMHIERHSKTEHVLWHECTDVRRSGRHLEVLRSGSWQTVPSPNAAADAQWLEARIRELLHAQREAPRDLPQEAAAALQALKQKT